MNSTVDDILRTNQNRGLRLRITGMLIGDHIGVVAVEYARVERWTCDRTAIVVVGTPRSNRGLLEELAPIGIGAIDPHLRIIAGRGGKIRQLDLVIGQTIARWNGDRQSRTGYTLLARSIDEGKTILVHGPFDQRA